MAKSIAPEAVFVCSTEKMLPYVFNLPSANDGEKGSSKALVRTDYGNSPGRLIQLIVQ
jgi:hypothetical protein